MDAERNAGLEIRAPREEEFHEILEIANLGFGEESTPEDEEDLRRTFPFDRALCAYDAGRMVGTLAVYSMELTLPGRRAVPAGGASWGGTLPTHRRRGILRALFAAQIADMVRREEPVSVLLASEASIYGRFGYGPATSGIGFTLDRAYAAFVDPPLRSAPENITLVAEVEAAGRLATVYEAARLDQPGAVTRSPKWWAHYLRDPLIERQGATKMYHAVHSGPDGVDDGYVSYRVRRQWAAATPMYEVQVVDFVSRDLEAYKALWQYILQTDLVQTIVCFGARVDEPLRWMLADPRRLSVNALVDELYVRLLDIPRALAAREYATGGELVLEVSETFPLARRGRYLLRVGETGADAECHPTDRPADLVLALDALGAAYLGGVSLTTLVRAGRAQAPAGDRLRLADTMFSTGVAPFSATMF
jgi:predicted acetyltransferase